MKPMKLMKPLRLMKLRPLLWSWWRRVRTLAGDDAYERYLAHRACHHADGGPPPTRAEFYQRELERKWNRPHRCC